MAALLELITYIIRDPLFLDIKLSSRKGIEKREVSDTPSIRIIYFYLGFRVSCLVLHREDTKFYLINLLRLGERKD